MRTSPAAWTAALAVMSLRGPFTLAEAAPARPQHHEQPGQFFPKHMRRGYNHSSSTTESSSSSGPVDLSSRSSSASLSSYVQPKSPTKHHTTRGKHTKSKHTTVKHTTSKHTTAKHTKSKPTTSKHTKHTGQKKHTTST